MERNVEIIQRIKNLSDLYKEYSIDGYLIPSTDEYLNEYLHDYFKRLSYISGFTGSNGYVIIFSDKILFFTDGRYITQAENQLPKNLTKIYDIKNIADLDLIDLKFSQIGYNPELFCKSQLNIFKTFQLKEIKEDLIDKIWLEDRPLKSTEKAFTYDDEFSGQVRDKKILNIQTEIKSLKADYHLITDCISICWILNIRASDVPFCPLLLSRLVISKENIYLFTDLSKIDHLDLTGVIILEESKIYEFLSQLTGTIILDKNKVPVSYLEATKHLNVINNIDLCLFPKACKNDVEIQGAKNAHIKDAIALLNFFSWLEESLNSKKELTEFDLGKQLTYFRSEQDGYIRDSFSAICGFQDNSAIIHYRAQKSSAKKIEGEGLLLIDSGGHYYGGTTDITRTINIGTPNKDYIKFYTKVLKGHIALFNIKFPDGICSSNLDVLARQYLWQEGCDYPHGTGHGVGNVLSVHEGPQSLNTINNISLKRNMILSNEPGYYIKNYFGIRIENLMYVKNSEYNGFFEFENLTMMPYCNELIDVDMLDKVEKKYLVDFYHNINITLTPLLNVTSEKYLKKQIELLLARF